MNPGTVPDAIQEGHSPAGFTGGDMVSKQKAAVTVEKIGIFNTIFNKGRGSGRLPGDDRKQWTFRVDALSNHQTKDKKCQD